MKGPGGKAGVFRDSFGAHLFANGQLLRNARSLQPLPSSLQPLPAKSICHIAILTLMYGAIDGGDRMNMASQEGNMMLSIGRFNALYNRFVFEVTL